MSESDPIREFHAQKERAEFTIHVCSLFAEGKITADVAKVALVVAGVPTELAAQAVDSVAALPTLDEPSEDLGAETKDPDDGPYMPMTA